MKGGEMMFEIDVERCIGCGQCARVCPFTCIGVADNKAVRLRRCCMKCMHCAVVCPKDAITVRGKSGCDERAFGEVTAATKAELEKMILQRRSYRHFAKKKVARNVLEQALNMTLWSPSAKNQHPVSWIIVDDEAVKQEIMDKIVAVVKKTGFAKEIVSELEDNHNNLVMGENSTILLAYCNDKANSPLQDTAIAMANAELLLQASGIGTCWAGYLQRFMNEVPELKARFGLAEGYSYYGAMMLGYPERESYRRIPARYKQANIKWAE
jgi:nitroreductase/NAD-dependent dihydropyrimidine dehydrogenase PreA subunit